jgi:peptidoglycan/LPS O-acetylase OafA/YrhL
MGIAQLFRRVTTSGGYVAEIDGLRFIAVMAVILLHTEGYWTHLAGRTYATLTPVDTALKSLISLGYYGVHLFFMISGFVLAMPFCKYALAGGNPVDLGAYFWRRVTRLEPPYFVSMLLFFAFMPVFGKGSWHEQWPHLLASLGYVHELVYGEGSPINNNAWSLEIEIQFYLLMPLIAAALWLSPALRRGVLAAATVVLSLNSLWLPADAPRTFLQFGQYFFVGIILCDLWTTDWRARPRTLAADAPGIVAWPLFAWVNLAHHGVISDVANPWLISLLFYSALRGVAHSRVLSYAFIPIVGGMCYSIYLLHARAIAFVVHGVLSRLPLFGNFTADYCVVLASCAFAALAVSAIFFLLVEKPCMDPAWPARLMAWVRRRVGSIIEPRLPAAGSRSSQRNP